MSWTLVSQILLMTLVGGMTISGVVGDIQKRHASGRVALAKAVLEVQAEAHAAHSKTAREPWNVN